MKKIRLLFLTLVALLGAVSASASKTVYIQPNAWSNDGAVISLNAWGDGENTWVSLTEVKTGIFKATLVDGKTTMAIVRGTEANKWQSEGAWNQTADMEITDGKLYKLYDYDSKMDGIYVDHGVVMEDYVGYMVDFNTSIATSNHDFSVGSNWGHVVDYLEYDDYGTEYAYVNYTFSSNGGVDGTGALGAYSQNLSGGGDSKTAYDLLITPLIQGTVTIDVKAMNYSDASLEVYALESDGKTKSTLIKSVSYSDLSTTDYTTISFELATEQRVGLRLNRVYIDNFAASSATILAEPKLSITSVKKATDASNVYFEQQADGSLLVQLYVTLKNDGEVDFETGVTENYTLSVLQDYYGTKSGPFGAFDIPVNLAKGETSDPILLEINVPAESVSNLKTWGYWYVIENVTSSQSTESVWASWTAYEPKFVFRESGSTSTSSISAAESWGTIMLEKTKSFEIANTGTAPLTIKSVTLPDGFTSDNAPVAEFVLAKGETQALNITQDATVQGTFAGTLSIVYLDKNGVEQTYNLAFSTTVIGANTWTADFNNSSSTVVYPAGSVAEGGINKDYQYISSGNYNNWLTGRTGGSYNTENNKFITPKLHANAGDKLAFDAKAGYSGTNDYFVKVYVSTDRKTWGDPVAYYTYSTDAGKGSEGIGSAFTTKTISFDAEGDYYVAFALYGTTSSIDNLVGLEKVDVAHDLYIKSVSWPDASIKSGSTQSKPSVTFIPLTTETAENYTVKYLSGTTVLGEGTSKALTASANSSTDIAINWTPNVTETTVYPETKVVIEFTDGTKFETETFDLTVTNEPIFHFVKTLPSSKWNEPSDYTTPITFGKTNSADVQSFYVYNWGSAALNVKSISVPEGFTVTPAEAFNVAAFDEDNLSAAAQAVEVTFSAESAGTYNGNLVVTYDDGNGSDQTFELPISGTKLDPTKWYANFNDEAWPAGSVYQDNVSISYINTGDYGLMSSSSTKNLFITPKLTAVAGDVLQFDASTRNSYYDGTVKVYIGTDRENFGDAVKEIALSKDGNVSKSTYEYQFAAAGDYYVAFALEEARVDELYGLKLANVAHDWKIASSNIPTEGMQNYSSTATVNVLNLGIADEAADSYTVTAYVDGVAAGTGTAVAIPMNHKLSDAGTQLSVSYMSNKVGTFPVYLEVKAGDYSVQTAPVDVTFAAEVAKAEADMATNGTTYEVPLYLNYKNSESVTMYNAEALAAAGISAGTKIKKITYKGYKTTDEQTTSFQVYYKWTDDQTLSQPATTYPFAAEDDGMTKLIDEDHTWAKVGSSSELGEMIVLDFTGSPLTYETGKSLVIYMHSYVDGYKTAYFEKSTLSSDYCYTRRADAATLSSAFSKAVPAAIHFTLDATTATLSGTVKNSSAAGIEGATVTLKADNGVEYSGTTAADGSYSINVIQAGLDFTTTVEKDGYLKKQFDLNMGGASKTNDVVMYTKMGIVGDAGLGLDWNTDLVMTQSTEDPNIFTLTVKGVGIAAGTFYYKMRADGAWLGDGVKYELPNSGNNKFEFGTTMYPAGTYNLIFTANTTDHTLTLQPVLQLTLDDSEASALDYENAPADVTVGRTLKAGWNAMVLPFDVTAEEIAAQFGANAQVAEFTGDEKNDDKVSVNFAKSDVITANKPFLINLESVPGTVKFLNKSVTFAEAKSEGTNFDFVGIYADGSAVAGDYIMAGGMLKYANGGNAIKAYRSYLKLKVAAPARISIFLDGELIGEAEGTGEATGIQGIGVKQAEGLYNMGGQKVTGRTKKGVYILNGKKVFVGDKH